MASVDYKKTHSKQEARAMIQHADMDARLVHNHTNTDIHTEMTPENTALIDGSVQDKYGRFTQRLRVLDSTTNTNRRKDRVEMFALNIPLPKGLTNEQEDELCRAILPMLTDNQDNIIYADIHRDEVHAYTDARTHVKAQSAHHMHVGIIPEIGGKLVGKQYSSRKRMMQINKQIDALCRQRYGVRFLTGEGKHHAETVEQLKIESMHADIAEAQQARKDIADLRAQRADLQASVADLRDNYSALQDARQKASDDLKMAQKRATDWASAQKNVPTRPYNGVEYVEPKKSITGKVKTPGWYRVPEGVYTTMRDSMQTVDALAHQHDTDQHEIDRLQADVDRLRDDATRRTMAEDRLRYDRTVDALQRANRRASVAEGILHGVLIMTAAVYQHTARGTPLHRLAGAVNRTVSKRICLDDGGLIAGDMGMSDRAAKLRLKIDQAKAAKWQKRQEQQETEHENSAQMRTHTHHWGMHM